jgi:predicted TIM-barrel fold metal-dependent hydrolase
MTRTYLAQRKVIQAPRTAVPEGAVDSHAHIFGPSEEYPFASERGYTPVEASLDDYEAMIQTIGFERMVIVQPSVYGFDNRCTMDAVERLGRDRARAIVHVRPEDSAGDLRTLRDHGARGVRFITRVMSGTSLDDLSIIAGRCADHGWHLQMYLPSQTWVDLAPKLRELPVPVVIDHMGDIMADVDTGSPGRLTILKLLERENFWVKLCGYRCSVSGYPYRDVAPWARRLIEVAPDRCVWGTDWPHPGLSDHMPDDGELVDLLADWCPDKRQREAILVDNPVRLYDF